MAKLESDFSKVTEVNSILKSPDVGDHLDLKDLDVPQEFHGDIVGLILRNQDLFASKDTDLGHTETVQMKIDTGDSSPIKLRPYRAPLNKREVIEKTVNEMLEQASLVDLGHLGFSQFSSSTRRMVLRGFV